MKYLLIFASLAVMTNANADPTFPFLAMASNDTALRQSVTIYCYSCVSTEDSRCLKGSSLTDEHKGYCISPYDRCGKVYGIMEGTEIVVRGCADYTDCDTIGAAFPQLTCTTCNTNYCNSSVKINSTYLAIVLITLISFLKYFV